VLFQRIGALFQRIRALFQRTRTPPCWAAAILVRGGMYA
jgi:hypothetical protein